ncbi:MAG TPA: DUF2442 domain-containing protein [Gemmatimonadaceae bacterium]|jgi:hypothetical protein|nr:DUF2442 domain-containing protein [Gemmatimonadaceae bacterium]
MRKPRTPTDAEIFAQIPAARAREAADRKAGLRAVSVWYDPMSEHVMMLLSNRRIFGVPVSDIPSIKHATPDQLKVVELTPAGDGLCWDALNVDLSVPGLLLETLGHPSFTSALARVAGRSRSAAKARSSRENGAKGGRPRKKAA